jgi:two-component system, NtrC family, nitrogen regulation response regulator GlnG
MIHDGSTAARRGPRGGAVAGRVPALTIAAHPNPARVGDRLVLDGLAAGREVTLARNAPDFVRPGRALGAPLGDPFVSRHPIRLAPAAGDRIRLVSEGGATAVEIDGVERTAIELGPLAPGAGIPIALADRLVLVLHLIDLDEPGPAGADAMGMVGDGDGVRAVRRAIAQVVDLLVPVLIRGETGTGKELVARALHEHGPRRAGRFVSVNLGAVPKELAAAELFGAVRGAFTGATRDRDGLFRAARGGTLFLDEIGEAPPEVQVMLLRVLETGELYPVGGDAPIATDVRLIAATDAHLDALIADGRFKAPLLHRLAGHEIHLPPLRERAEDLGLLFHHFAREELTAIGEAARLEPTDPLAEPWLPPAIATRLLRFRWPGNIRQLRNVTRQLVIGSRGRAQLQLEPRLAAELDAGAVPLALQAAPVTASPEPPSRPITRRRPADISEPELLAALRAHAWDLKAAADQLGIPRPSIYDVIERCPNIRTAGDLTADEIARVHRDCAGDLDRMAAQLEVSRRALQRRVKELGLEVAKAKPDG